MESAVFMELIECSPEILLSSFSIGVAADVAMVLGSAPDKLSETIIFVKSTFGKSLTGSYE